MPPKKLPPNAFNQNGTLKRKYYGQSWANSSDSNNSLPPSPIYPSAPPNTPENGVGDIDIVGQVNGNALLAQKFENAFKGNNPQGIDLTKASQSKSKSKKKKRRKITNYYKKTLKRENKNNKGGPPGLATGTKRKKKNKKRKKIIRIQRCSSFRRTKNSKSNNKRKKRGNNKKKRGNTAKENLNK